MLFISVNDFFNKAAKAHRISKEEEKKYALQKADGDAVAREKIISSYLPFVASYIKRAPNNVHTLKTVYCCVRSLEEGVDSFNFLQDNETFSHHLSRRLRQTITSCIVDRY